MKPTDWKNEKKILLIEDQDRGAFFQEFLEVKYKLNVTWIESLDEAWDTICREQFDLIILDVMMPIDSKSPLYSTQVEYNIKNEYGMFSGLLLLIKLRLTQIYTEPCKVILFSARSRERVDGELKNLREKVKYDAFVPKSDDPDKLYTTIENLLVL